MGYIAHFIKDNLRKGISLEIIKKSLLSAGYSNAQMDEAVRELYKEQVTDLARYISKELKHGLSPSAVRNYLIAIGHPKGHVEHAISKIITAKKYLLRKKKIEKIKEQFKDIKNKMKKNISRYLLRIDLAWGRLSTVQKFSFIPAAAVYIILLFWEIIMMISSIILSGNLNCYSFGRVVSCSFFESVLFYLLLMLAFIIIFCLPVFLVGALIGFLIERLRK
jgi:hypothetical protein